MMPLQLLSRSWRGYPVRPPDSGIARRKSIWERIHIDPWLLGLLLALMAGGLLVLYSASGQRIEVVIAQAVRFGLALVGMFVLAQFSPTTFLRWAPLAYGVGLAMLVAVEIAGDIGMGAKRWLEIPGVIRFQPSEMMKLAVPLMVAAYLNRCQLPPRLRDIAVCGLIIGAPVVLTAIQPDLGTALLMASAALIVVLLAGLSWRLISLVVALAAAGLPLLWMNMHNYQRQRVLTFLDPESDPLGSGWNIIQSKIAIGSGGITGKGFLNGTQSHLDYLPEGQTDFVFATMAEEWGLLGGLFGAPEGGGGGTGEQTYTVQAGDNLSKIAKQFYGNPNKYPVIFEANKPMLKDPDKIYPGQKLRIPAL